MVRHRRTLLFSALNVKIELKLVPDSKQPVGCVQNAPLLFFCKMMKIWLFNLGGIHDNSKSNNQETRQELCAFLG